MSGLDRLARLYARVERARLMEARAAAASCDEVRVLRQEATREARTQEDVGRDAFVRGDAAERGVSEAVRAAALVLTKRLLRLESEREVTLDVAEALYRESRLQAEQMEKAVTRIREKTALEEGRRAQAAADDRFGSRLRWKQGQVRDEGPLM